MDEQRAVYGLCPPCGLSTIDFASFRAVAGALPHKHAAIGTLNRPRLWRVKWRGTPPVAPDCQRCGGAQVWPRYVPEDVIGPDFVAPIGARRPGPVERARAREEWNHPATRLRFERYHASRRERRREGSGFYLATFPSDGGKGAAFEVAGPEPREGRRG